MPWTFLRSKNDKEENQLYFGVELETALPRTSATTQLLNSATYVSIAGDCSIVAHEGERDYELRFHPATWLWLMAHRMKIAKFLTAMDQMGGHTGSDRQCGMHIHFSHVLPQEHLLNFMHFVFANAVDIQRWSERTQSSMNHYSRLLVRGNAVERDSTGRILPNDGRCMCGSCLDARAREFGNTFAPLNEGDLRGALHTIPTDHYSAVNYSSRHNTIEVRIFAGTFDPCKFFANIEFVKSVIEFTEPARGYNHEQQCNMTEFRRWLHNRKLRMLERFLDERLGAPAHV